MMAKQAKPWEILAANLERLMKAQGWNALSLSREARQSDTAVRDILKFRSKNPGRERLGAIAAVLGVSVESLYQPPGAEGDKVPATGVSVQAEMKHGMLVLKIPASSPIVDTALKLVQLYGAASEEDRAATLLRLQHPGLAGAGTPETARNQALADLEEVVTATVDKAIARGTLRLSRTERLRLIAEMVEEGETIMTAAARAARPQRDDLAAAKPGTRRKLPA